MMIEDNSEPRKPAPQKEYMIRSNLGDWPEILDFDGVVGDLAFNRSRYPEVDFIVLERTVTHWIPTTDVIPEVEHEYPPDHPRGYVSAADEAEIKAWLEEKDG